MIVEIIPLAIFALYVHVNYFIALLSLLTFRSRPLTTKLKLPKVSVIIATKNEENIIEDTLKRIRRSNYPKNKLEIIVIDSSTDNTYKIAKKYADVVIRDKVSRGKPRALNFSIKKAKGELLYFIDADSELEKNAIKNMVSHISRDHAACVGRILSKNKNSLVAKIYRLQDSILNFSTQVWLNSVIKTHFIPGRNYVIYKDELLKLGGFHDVLTEDVNISYRLYKKGKKIAFCNTAVSYETAPVKFKHFWKQQERWYAGLSNEINKSFTEIRIYDIFVLVPVVITMFSIHIITMFSLLAFLFTGSYFFLAAFVLGGSVILSGPVKSLDKDELLILPLTSSLLAIIQVLILLNLLIKKILNIKIEWYKTPKDNS